MNRCRWFDSDGCRCLRPAGHTGEHDPSLTPWPSLGHTPEEIHKLKLEVANALMAQAQTGR